MPRVLLFLLLTAALAASGCMLTHDLGGVALERELDSADEHAELDAPLETDTDADVPPDDDEGPPDGDLLDDPSDGDVDDADDDADDDTSDAELGDTSDTEVDEDVGPPTRVEEGLLVLYTFAEGSGSFTNEAHGDPALVLASTSGDLPWIDARRGLAFDGQTTVKLATPSRFYELTKGLDAFTLEFRVRADLTLNTCTYGCRIFAAASGDEHNLSVSSRQNMLRLAIRSSGGLTVDDYLDLVNGSEQHFFVTWDGSNLAVYVDSQKLVQSTPLIEPSAWAEAFPVTVGNSDVGDAGWTGELFLFALYDHPLSDDERSRNLAAWEP